MVSTFSRLLSLLSKQTATASCPLGTDRDAADAGRICSIGGKSPTHAVTRTKPPSGAWGSAASGHSTPLAKPSGVGQARSATFRNFVGLDPPALHSIGGLPESFRIVSASTFRMRQPCDEAVIRSGTLASPCAEKSRPWILAATILG